MPKLIDYPRTNYLGAWEIAEIVDDTGGKCALETAARKLNRKVSGSFKAIVGSAVKFGLLTSKREMLTTTTLFRRIKHAYDKQEELLFHREAFLTPPLFSQLCRKFRSRELPVAMLDVLLIREFDVEEINSQGVAKAFVEGARMVGLLDEHDILADIDQLSAQQPPRRELASPPPASNIFRQPISTTALDAGRDHAEGTIKSQPVDASPQPTGAAPATIAPKQSNPLLPASRRSPLPASRPAPAATADAIANLFNLSNASSGSAATPPIGQPGPSSQVTAITSTPTALPQDTTAVAPTVIIQASKVTAPPATEILFQLQLKGPGINTTLDVLDADDLTIVRSLLDKIERQLKRN